MNTERPTLEVIRGAEVAAVIGEFCERSRLLELGGGNGYQAKLLAGGGHAVISIDLPNRPRVADPYFPVQDYDGLKIPFADDSFDGVFSSNVLEHVVDLTHTLAELRRVTRSGGVGVHLLPTPAWRFWTIGTHYPWLATRILKGFDGPSDTENVHSRGAVQQRPFGIRMRNALGLAPHGEYANAISELYYFSKWRWTKVFTDNGFEVMRCYTNGLFYTGHMLSKSASLELRKKAANYLGGSCHVFVLRAVE